MAQIQENAILKEHFIGLNFEDLIKPDKEQEQVIKTINSIEAMMEEYAHEITYTQMRNIYGIVLESKLVTGLHRTRPRIAYIQARQSNEKAKKFVEFIIELIKVVQDENQLNEFVELMETMVAYHRLYGKNKN